MLLLIAFRFFPPFFLLPPFLIIDVVDNRCCTKALPDVCSVTVACLHPHLVPFCYPFFMYHLKYYLFLFFACLPCFSETLNNAAHQKFNVKWRPWYFFVYGRGRQMSSFFPSFRKKHIGLSWTPLFQTQLALSEVRCSCPPTKDPFFQF